MDHTSNVHHAGSENEMHSNASTNEKLSLRIDMFEASVASLRADFTYVRHIITEDIITDWKLFKSQVFKRLDETRLICTRLESRLENLANKGQETLESSVGQRMTSSVQSPSTEPEASQPGHRKRLFAETDLPYHSAPLTGAKKTENYKASSVNVRAKSLGNLKHITGLASQSFNDRIDEESNFVRPVSRGLSECTSSFSCEVDERVTLPDGMDLEFLPTKCMRLTQVETEVATYIFSSTKPKDELMVVCPAGHITRDEMHSLAPLRWVYGEVLTMVAAKMTHMERGNSSVTAWYFPPSFSHQVISQKLSVERAMRGYCVLFMSNSINSVDKIFIPINDGNVHWFLLIVCLSDEKLLYLDSDSGPSTQAGRQDLLRRMARFMELLLQDPRFHNTRWKRPLQISSWPISTPAGVARQDNSHDCGVCVGGWMALNSIWGDFKTVPRGSRGRMRLALDIVLGDFNGRKDDIIAAANQLWREHSNSITF